MNNKIEEPIATVDYNSTEKEVWAFCYKNLIDRFRTNACEEFNWTINEFQKNIGLCETEIPQLETISAFLKEATGWRLKPVGGLLTQREFLNSLAFRIFCSTQYVRHSSEPLYTPEPDILHELLGHAPMFAHQEFADFS
jgi:phenylalanine-4-hydroxylase